MPEFTPIRITLLGAAKVGKTALVSGFVSNFSPQIYTQTQQDKLYYRTLDIEGHLVLAEVEDTKAWTPQPQEVDDAIRAQDLERQAKKASRKTKSAQEEATEKEHKHKFWEKLGGFGRGLRASEQARQAMQNGSATMLFSEFEPNVEKLIPVAGRRMAFLLVFDPGEPETFDRAKNAAKSVNSGFEKSRVAVILVASKMDMGLSTEAQKILQDAEAFAQAQGYGFEKVVAIDLQQVKRLFNVAIAMVRKRGIHLDPYTSLPTAGGRGSPTASSTRASARGDGYAAERSPSMAHLPAAPKSGNNCYTQ